MNNKILVGNIIAITVLIGVSFTSVVGYRSVASDVKASPLFNIRTQRAMSEGSKDLTCNYIGKEKQILITIPKRDIEMTDVQKVMDSIIKMDDTTFDRFIGLVVNRLQQDQHINDNTISKIVTLLKQLRNAPMNPENYIMFKNIDSKNRLPTGGFTMQCETFCGGPCNTLKVTPVACFLLLVVFLPIIIPIAILQFIWIHSIFLYHPG